MNVALRIGVIGGAGWLGGAIANSMLNAGIVRSEHLSLSYRSGKPERLPGAFWTTDNQDLVDRSDVVIMSVRPQDWDVVSIDAKQKLLISVMAGIRISALRERHKTERVVRTLPNAAADVSMSYTPWIASKGVEERDRDIVRAIFDACGIQDEVKSERDIDYLTGFSGTGPAFPSLVASAMMTHAVDHGLSADVARRAVITLLKGTGRLLEKREECPNDIVRSFVDYRGVTAAAIEEMRAAGLDDAVSRGLTVAFKKSESMGDSP
ncbi:pyrroline-5-carboxylate reductase family protein [Rhizobium mesoamericanum]|uniref:Pyrroline-5-carboxylate reductase n=1 Tax=Rhizobium mesoamericanum STM3625 TaxID=1211777 RepID=K0PQE7_9HYPH|nr:pyrroline-5-carboxylate reductase dimerization domain-containing protein [Rhizobium mesoamericanum]CCM76038.1 putative pyrroline-5-carboxylate reductase protein [Rhizobium mesoamericanum STM3625]